MLRYSDLDLQVPKVTSEVQNSGIKLVWDYLSKRGISLEDIDNLGIRIVLARDLIRAARSAPNMVEDSRLAIVFPHSGVNGEAIDWWSARLVETSVRPQTTNTFHQFVERRRLGKMFCPPAEAPHGYLVPTLDWTKIVRGDRVYIHESCIKAVNGSKLDTWSIGLNGVRGWSSRKHNIALVDEIKSLPWRALELKPFIVFDSNAADNWDVQHAISTLAAKIHELTGQRARHLLLPPGPDGHWGFDDYRVAVGDEAAKAYLEGEGTEIEISELELLKLQLNEEVCVVKSLGRVAVQETGTLMSRQTFVDVNYATYTALVEESRVSVPKLWLADTRRLEVEAIDYVPGADKVSGGILNMWRGMGLDPEQGDVAPWLDVLERNVKDPVLRKWVIQWMAYPLQNIGAKLNTFLHLWGPPGAGKQALLAPLMRIYGRNAIVIGKDIVSSSFNSIYANKQFINIDELHGGNESAAIAITNKLKMMTTGETSVVNTKGQPEYEVRNCANIVTTSNYLDSIKLDEDDRRCCVTKFGERGQVAYGKDYWIPFWKWVENEGAAYVYDYLMKVDLGGFDPKGWAPMTEEKLDMTRATRSREQGWIQELWEDPNQVLPPICNAWCLATSDQLAQYCFGEDPQGVTPHKKLVLATRLGESGLKRIELKVDNRKLRFWIIRRKEIEWTSAEARAHLKSIAYPGVK